MLDFQGVLDLVERDDDDEDEDDDEDDDDWDADKRMPPPRVPDGVLYDHQLYSVADGRLVIEQAERGVTDSDVRARNRAIAAHIKQHGGGRHLRTLPGRWPELLDELAADFPNFFELLEVLHDAAALACTHDRVLRLSPICLDGPPGVGKTMLAEILARELGGGYRRVSVADLEAGFALTGSDVRWGNSGTGLVFELLFFGREANPWVLLDEIDKLNLENRYNAQGALLEVLEPATAGSLRDKSFPLLPLDASRVIWIATCNEWRSIPAPLQSRLTRIEVAAPTRAQLETTIASVWRHLLVSDVALSRFELADRTLSHLVVDAPRDAARLLRRAAARAARAGRRVIEPVDVVDLVRVADRRRVGFL